LADDDDIFDIASIFGGAVVEEKDDDGQTHLEHMYKPTEAIFGAVAQEMVAKGWSVFPQEKSGNRRPGTVNGEMIKFQESHNLTNRLPSPAALALWGRQCSTLNVAVVFGPGSGHTFAVDIDVLDEEFSQQIQTLAEKHLGPTPLRRVGRWPKMAFIYRRAPEDEISSRQLRFVELNPDNPDPDPPLLEIVSTGRPMTFYGHHHKTGRYFRWLEGPPTTHGPESAPLVTSAQLGDFLDAVDSIRPFSRSISSELASVTFEYDENAKVHVPRIRAHGGASAWTENEEGKVADGREEYMMRLALRVVQANAHMLGSKQGVETLVKTVVDTFMATAEVTGRWRGQQLVREARSKVDRFARKVVSGELSAHAPARNDQGEYVTSASARAFVPAQPRKPEGDSLDFLPPFVDPEKPGFDFNKEGQRRPMRIQLLDATSEEVLRRREERRISEDRTLVAEAVSDGLLKAFCEFWDEVYDLEQRKSRVHILKAPTGAGKTSRGINFIAQDPRTKQPYTVYGDSGEVVCEGQAPILVLMPTYANIEELRHRAQVLNLDGSLSDTDLMKQAFDRGLFHEDELESRLADLRRDAMDAGITTMIYSGKLKAGCKMADKVKMAMAAGLGTSGFCKAEIDTPDIDAQTGKPIKEERFCPFYHQYEMDAEGNWKGCPAIEQKKKIEECHVVFLPHAFLALQIPDELKNVRAVVADERIHHLFLHTMTFEMGVFLSPRKPPRLTKKERDQGVVAEEFQQERMEAVFRAMEALKTKRDPAEHLLAVKERDPTTGQTVAFRWVDAALRSCGASMAKDDSITPDITEETLAEICARPTGQAVREEYRFWKIILERMEARRDEKVVEDLYATNGEPMPETFRKTRGDRDMRIQLFQDELESGEVFETIRISWRETPNWVERPLLLLDASAAPDMIRKIWQGKDVVVHDIPAALNVRIVGIADRTYSNSSVIANPSASQREKVASAKLLTKVRKSISIISGLYGWHRVVAGGSIAARRAVNLNWEGPHNVDWCHYGAMRGLDFAKYHSAAISVGRMELPVRIIDGLVAALTYDDDVPETPYDRFGTGLNEAGQALLIPSGNQLVRMRSGHDIYMPVPMFPGRWGRMIQKQYREEELLQFLGRLRPVYREGDAPIWFSLSSVIPEEIIVDDLINIDDLIKRGKKHESPVWDAVRRCQGIIDVDLGEAVCDDLFGNRAAVIRGMNIEGMDPKTGQVDKRVAWSMVTLAWEDENGRTGYSFARGDVQDPAEALRNAYERYHLPKLVKVEQITSPKFVSVARGRTPDTIEHELGTLDERRSREERQQMEVAMRMLMSVEPDDIKHLKTTKMERQVPVPLPTGVRAKDDDENSKAITCNFIEMEARASIDALWRSKGYDPDAHSDTVEKKPAPAEEAASAENIMTDETLVKIGERIDDKAQEFDLYKFDPTDTEIPW
jgi:hypothetical protein